MYSVVALAGGYGARLAQLSGFTLVESCPGLISTLLQAALFPRTVQVEPGYVRNWADGRIREKQGINTNRGSSLVRNDWSSEALAPSSTWIPHELTCQSSVQTLSFSRQSSGLPTWGIGWWRPCRYFQRCQHMRYGNKVPHPLCHPLFRPCARRPHWRAVQHRRRLAQRSPTELMIDRAGE